MLNGSDRFSRLPRRLIRLSALVLVAVLTAGSTLAYTLLSPQRRWYTTPDIVVDNRGLAGVSDGDSGIGRTVSAIEAYSAWNGAGAGGIVEAHSGSVSGFSIGDGTPMLNFFDPFSDCTGSCLAATYITEFHQRPDGGWEIDDADVVTNRTGHSWASQGEGCSGEYYVEAVMVHEVGHVLGLGHTPASGATMQATTGTCNSGPQTTALDDERGAHCLYRGPDAWGEGVYFASRNIGSFFWDANCLGGANADIFRSGTLVASNTANDGQYTDMFFGPPAGSANYWACQAGSTTWYDSDTCSDVVTLYFSY